MITYESISPALRGMVNDFITLHWHGLTMVLRGKVYDMSQLPGICALENGQLVGLATYRVDGKTAELMSLDSQREGAGIGTTLLDAVKDTVRAAGCTQLLLITTNDNTGALRFYQRRGFDLIGLHLGAIEAARAIKPGIPKKGEHGIPLRHELELACPLAEKNE